MKKTLILPTLICAAAMALAPSASTFAFDWDGDGIDDGPRIAEGEQRYYTIEEALSYGPELVSEIQAQCDSTDPWCYSTTYYALTGSVHKYEAFRAASARQLMVADYNPSTQALDLIYYGKDAVDMSKGGDTVKYLNELYSVWFEDDIYYTHLFVNHIKNNLDTPGMHTLINEPDASWMPENTTISLDLSGLGLPDNASHVIHYQYVFKDNHNNTYPDTGGTYDYSECLASPDYWDGATCTTYIDLETLGIAIFPSAKPVEPEPAQTGDEDGYGAVATPAQDASAGNSSIKAPNTGVASTDSACDAGVEFPWWIIALIVAGDALVVWWFLPNRHKIR